LVSAGDGYGATRAVAALSGGAALLRQRATQRPSR
jgi:hypothetical protein